MGLVLFEEVWRETKGDQRKESSLPSLLCLFVICRLLGFDSCCRSHQVLFFFFFFYMYFYIVTHIVFASSILLKYSKPSSFSVFSLLPPSNFFKWYVTQYTLQNLVRYYKQHYVGLLSTWWKDILTLTFNETVFVSDVHPGQINQRTHHSV